MPSDRHSRHPSPSQLPLFTDLEAPLPEPASPDPVPVTPFTELAVARVWFRQHLIESERPTNTVESYIYDLVVLEQRIGNKPLHLIGETDIALYLAGASSKVTRKRRLTSVKAFFSYYVEHLKILKIDPTSSFSPHPLEHNLPEILTGEEQQALLNAALTDEPWSAVAIWLMMRLGLGRTELLALRRDHIDRTVEPGAEVVVAYDAPGKRGKQRTLKADATFALLYGTYVQERSVTDVLFPVGPQAVNGMVDRVAAAAGIERKITPQLLRHTAAVDLARSEKSVNALLAWLGLANDARNRETIRLYLAAAEPAAET